RKKVDNTGTGEAASTNSSIRFGVDRVLVRLVLISDCVGLSASCHHGSNSASRADPSERGLTHGGAPTWRSKPPCATTGAHSSSQWKNACSWETSSSIRSHGCSSKHFSSIRTAPAKLRLSSSNLL